MNQYQSTTYPQSSSTHGHLLALTAAIALHGALVAWLMPSHAPIVIPQQIIRIAMVAPSSVKQTEKIAEPTPAVAADITPPKLEGLRKVNPLPKKKTEKHQPAKPEHMGKIAEQVSHLSPTSGPQAPDATATKAVLTDPVFNAAYLNNPAPSYPDTARRRGIQGKAMLQVRVTTTGAPQQVAILHSSGFSQLDDAALDAVRHWKFVPARRGNDIIEASVIVPVEFKLN